MEQTTTQSSTDTSATQTVADSQPWAQLPEGLQTMTPLEMNEVGFSKRHTVLTPELLKNISA